MRPVPFAVAAGVSLAIVGAAQAYDFTLASVAVVPDGMIVPSAGYFVTQHPSAGMENAYLSTHTILGGTFAGHNISPLLTADVWRFELDEVMASTWLALDPYGPKGQGGSAPYGAGWFGARSAPPRNGQPATTVNHPAYNAVLGTEAAGLAVNGENGDPVDGDGLSIGFFGASAGFAWSAGIDHSFNASSESSVVAGEEVDSLFLGHFVLSSPGATIIGDDLLLAFRFNSPGPEAKKSFRLPLDGTAHPIAGVSFRIVQERTSFTNSLGAFTAVDLYLVSTGTPIGMPETGMDDGDPSDDPSGDMTGDMTGDENGDETDPNAPQIPDDGSTDTDGNGRTELRDIALTLDIPDLSPAYLANVLRRSGFDPARYSAQEWTTLMNGLYRHRILPSLPSRPSSSDRNEALALLFGAYTAAGPAAANAVPDNGLPDANSSGMIDFADVALILESDDEDSTRLEFALASAGLDPANFEKRGHWKKAIKTFYASEILPEFTADREKKAQKRDRKRLQGLY